MNVRLPKVGDRVNVIEKRNYESGKLTSGKVRRLLSNPKEVHPRGNKVELEDGTVGRTVSFVDEVGVQELVDPAVREQFAQEIRAARPERRPRREGGERFRSREPRPERDQPRDLPERNETVEPPFSNLDLPGENDLR